MSWSLAGRLYAVVDACGRPHVPLHLAKASHRAEPLYRPRSNLAALADTPYLVEVDPSALLWFQTALWPDEDWGLFLVLPEPQGSPRSDTTLRALHRHLRTFLQVLSPTSDLWLFRGHDPRLVPAFLGASTPAEARAFFGPAERLILVAPDGMLREFVPPQRHASEPDDPPARAARPFRMRPEHVAAMRAVTHARTPFVMAAELKERGVATQWDPHARELVCRERGGDVVKLRFDERSLPCAVVSPGGHTWGTPHDENGKLAALINPDGPTIRFGYDAEGRLSAIERSGRTHRIEYDGRGRVVRLSFPDDSARRYTYDKADVASSATDRLGSTTRFVVENDGHLVEKVDPLGRRTRYVLDEERGAITSIFPDETTETVEARPESSTATFTRRDGRRAEIEVDNINEPRSVRWADGRVTAGVGVVDTAPARECTFSDGVVTQTTDLAGRLVERRLPDGSTHSFAYDADGRLTRVSAWGAEIRFEHSPGGALQGRVYMSRRGSSLTERREYADAGRLSRTRLIDGSGREFGAQQYHYDACDRLSAYVDHCNASTQLHEQVFTHDLEGRLIHERCTVGPSRSAKYRYDQKGNMLADGSVEQTFGVMDELRSRDQVPLEYDANGRLTGFTNRLGRVSARFADDDALLSVDVAGRTVRCEYDALGRRIRKTCGKQTWTYHWVGHQLVWEDFSRSPDESPTRREYLYAPPRGHQELEDYTPLAFQERGRVYWLQQDARGATIRAFDEHGEVVWAAAYDAFGAAHVSVARIRQPWRLLGQYDDEETGLYYNYGRYYCPHIKQYLSRDPRWDELEAPPYSYCGNDPLNHVDPLGQLAFIPVLIFVARIAIGVGVGMVVDYLAEKAIEAIGAHCQPCAKALGILAGIKSFFDLKNLIKNLPRIFRGLRDRLRDLRNLWRRLRRTKPTGPKNGAPSGNKSPETGSSKRGHRRENEAADTLANGGYRVEQNPGTLPNGKNPDYKIEGKYFDCVSPTSNNIDQVRKGIADKVTEAQADRIIVNLDDSKFDPSDIADVLARKPKEGLQEVIVVKDGVITPVFP